MSRKFPTHRQFTSEIRARLLDEYPEADQPSIEDCVRMQAGVNDWLHHLGKLIEQGADAELRVLDTLTASQLHALKMDIAPRGSLDWYVPAIYRRKPRNPASDENRTAAKIRAAHISDGPYA